MIRKAVNMASHEDAYVWAHTKKVNNFGLDLRGEPLLMRVWLTK
ncbi:MAG: hypothetical protein Q8P50_11490 [Bacillota bacterium]|nr:hypothetical protein [Bacillota bacterium]